MKYIFKNKLSYSYHSNIISKDNYKRQPYLSSTFDKEEISELLKTIDRSSPKGRLDYGILLLATKLGLRPSEIRKLEFAHIIWNQNIIEFKRQKSAN